MAKLQGLVDMFQDDVGRVDLSDVWRPFTNFEANTPSGDSLRKVDKLVHALRRHFAEVADADSVRRFLSGILQQLENKWGLKNL